MLLLASLALAQDPAPPAAAVPVSETVDAPAALALEGDDRVRLEALLAPVAVLSGQERVDHLLGLLAEPESAPVKAGLARALSAAYQLDVGHEALRAQALQLPALQVAAPTVDPQVAQLAAEKRLAAMRTYKAQRLEVREETELRGGGTSALYGPSFGTAWGGAMSTPMSTDPIYAVQTWGIYQGKVRLTVPEYLELTEQVDLGDALAVDIERSQRQSKALYGVGLAGVALAGVGVIGQINTTDVQSYNAYRYAALGGVVAAVGGFVGGSVPAARARELEEEPSYRFTPDQVQPRLDAYNEALRIQLGLEAEDALLLESVP